MITPLTHEAATGSTTPTTVPALTTVCTAAALYLMSQHARQPCPLIAHAIADQLRRLAATSPAELSPVIRRLAASLLPMWCDIACGAPQTYRH